jgi:hypothetical protein
MRYASALLLLSLTAPACAQLLAPRGAKATLEVEYLYTAAGTSGRRNDTDTLDEWKVRRVVNITAQYVAEEPMAIGVLHKPDATQQAAIDSQQKQIQDFSQKMAPTVADMMQIADRCGEDEACIEKAIAEYGNKMDVKEMQARKEEGQAIFKPGTPRYQLWRLTSQNGTYEIDETISRQVFEMTCTRTKVCKRTVTTRGKGAIQPPPGAPVAGTSLLEVDSAKKDMATKMPVPLQPLKVESRVETSIPDDDYKAEQILQMRILGRAESLTLAIPGDALQASGTATIKDTGHGAESGTLTVKWTFERQ